MVKRIFFFLASAILLPLALAAQNSADALRYSSFEVSGTGRFVGVNGSLGAFGTEFSVLSTNPAGLAMYRSSEVVVSPSMFLVNAESQLEGAFRPSDNTFLPTSQVNSPVSDSRTAFNLSNLGFVIQSNPRNPNFSSMNFGIGLNNIANFNQQFSYNGSSAGSIAERWEEIGNSVDFDPNTGRPFDFEAGPAWDAFAIYEIEPSDGFLHTDYELTYDAEGIGLPVSRNQTVTSQGSMSELVVALATNYRERLMVGMTLGVPFVNYRQNKTYREVDDGAGPEGSVPFFDELSFEESIITTGVGFNFKMGFLYRATQALRLGFAFHTPTSLNLDDEFDLDIAYTFTDNQGSFTGVGESEPGLFGYRLRTPWRLFGNAGLLIRKSGFISAEVEWVDYSKANYRYNEFPQDEQLVNDEIATVLKSVVNVRVGGEFAYKILRFRAGFGLLPSPFEGDDNAMNYSYSAGMGARFNKFFVDFAWRNRSNSSGYIPYGTFDRPQQFVGNEFNNNHLVLSVGIRY